MTTFADRRIERRCEFCGKPVWALKMSLWGAHIWDVEASTDEATDYTARLVVQNPDTPEEVARMIVLARPEATKAKAAGERLHCLHRCARQVAPPREHAVLGAG